MSRSRTLIRLLVGIVAVAIAAYWLLWQIVWKPDA